MGNSIPSARNITSLLVHPACCWTDCLRNPSRKCIQTFALNPLTVSASPNSPGVAFADFFYPRLDPPLYSRCDEIRLSKDSTSIVPQRRGVLKMDGSFQTDCNSGTVVFQYRILLNNQILRLTDSAQFFWPAFVTGYRNVIPLSLALNVKAGDKVQIQFEASLIEGAETDGSVTVGGINSFLVLELLQ